MELRTDELQYIETQLAKLDFVRWDRYVVSPWGYMLFGWIKREDSHEDFVLYVYEHRGDEIQEHCLTSSAKWTHEVTLRLFGEEVAKGHKDCTRIEDLFPNLPNAIKL